MENNSNNDIKETLEKLGTVLAIGINLYKKIVAGLMIIIITLILTIGGVVGGFVYYLSQYNIETSAVGTMGDSNNVASGGNQMNADTITNNNGQ